MAAALVLSLVGTAGLAAFDAPAMLAPDGYSLRIALPVSRAAPPRETAAGALSAPLEAIGEAPSSSVRESDAAPVVAVAETSLPTPIAARPANRSKVPGVIALSYNLAGGAGAGDAIEVEKQVTFHGADAGRIPLRIDGNAKVFALGSRLAAIIAAQSGQAAVPQGLEKDYVSLDTLRALGIGVKYDAIRDRLVVEPPQG